MTKHHVYCACRHRHHLHPQLPEKVAPPFFPHHPVFFLGVTYQGCPTLWLPRATLARTVLGHTSNTLTRVTADGLQTRSVRTFHHVLRQLTRLRWAAWRSSNGNGPWGSSRPVGTPGPPLWENLGCARRGPLGFAKGRGAQEILFHLHKAACPDPLLQFPKRCSGPGTLGVGWLARHGSCTWNPAPGPWGTLTGHASHPHGKSEMAHVFQPTPVLVLAAGLLGRLA